MAYKVTRGRHADGTSRFALERGTMTEVVPVPRELILDGHCSDPHPDVVPVITWLCWPQVESATIAYGSAVSSEMAALLSDPSLGLGIKPYSVAHNLEPRQTAPSIIALDSRGKPGRGRNDGGGARVTFLDVRPIHEWRGRMLSTDSIVVSSNAYTFAPPEDTGSRSLASTLAVALHFVDDLRADTIVAAGFSAGSAEWQLCARTLLARIGIELKLTHHDTDLWQELTIQ